jgi:hypothetical protein
MISPKAINYYKQDKADPNNCFGKYELVKTEGIKIPELFHTLKNKPNAGKKVIYLYPFPKEKGVLALSNPSLSKHHPSLSKTAKNISKLAGTDINEASKIRLYGDIQFLNNPILVELYFNNESKERTLKIMTFDGGNEKALSLYQKWQSGTVKESTPDNNIDFSTKSVFHEDIDL